MTDPFLAEIRIFGFNFPPKGWAFCDGAIMPISQNTALFSLLGTNYGGDGKSNFGLPNLQGGSVVQEGTSPAGTQYYVGQQDGVPNVTLLQSEIPQHTHTPRAVPDVAELQAPAPDRTIARSAPGFAYQNNSTANLVTMDPKSLSIAGGSLPHNNMPPSLVLNFCIALQGVFPQRP